MLIMISVRKGIVLTPLHISYIVFCPISLITRIVFIILWFAFEMGYVSAWAVLLMFPFAVIPFTYVTSFIFTDTSTAQTLTLVLHVAIMAIGTSVIFTFRVLPIL